MNKELLISIKPEHLVNILNGKKTLELRRTVPKDYKGWVYIYCSKSGYNLIKVKNKFVLEKGNKLNYDLNGKVVARFWFDEYDVLYSYEDSTYNIWEPGILSNLQLTGQQIDNYGKGKSLYAWHIKQLEIFEKPKELSEFYKTSIEIEEIEYAIENYSPHAITKLYKYVITRPPLNYQLVYVKE